jgi:predicted nucleic acid-binding protein
MTYVIDSSVGIYDCLYITLAERQSCEFVTADDKLVQRLGPVFPFIVALSSLP